MHQLEHDLFLFMLYRLMDDSNWEQELPVRDG